MSKIIYTHCRFKPLSVCFCYNSVCIYRNRRDTPRTSIGVDVKEEGKMAWNGILYYNISAETSKEVKSTNDLRGQYNGKRTFRIEFKTRNVYRVQNFLDEWFSLSLKFFIHLKGFFFLIRFDFYFIPLIKSFSEPPALQTMACILRPMR